MRYGVFTIFGRIFFTLDLDTKRVSQKLDLNTTNLRTWKSLRDYAMILMLLCDFHLVFRLHIGIENCEAKKRV